MRNRSRAFRKVGRCAVKHALADVRVRAVHHATFDGLKVVIRLCLDASRLHEGEEYVQTNLEFAVAHFCQSLVVGRQNLLCSFSDIVTQAALRSILIKIFFAAILVNMFASCFINHVVFRHRLRVVELLF